MRLSPIPHLLALLAAGHAALAQTSTTAPAQSGSLACLTTTTKATSSCSLTTSGGIVSTITCSPTEVTTSYCAPGLLCTLDSSGQDICMKVENGLDASGVVVAIVLAAAAAIMLGALTFLCCKDRREQRRLAAKAEATALARAQTRKQRQRDQRTPLMKQQEGASGVVPSQDPFADHARA